VPRSVSRGPVQGMTLGELLRLLNRLDALEPLRLTAAPSPADSVIEQCREEGEFVTSTPGSSGGAPQNEPIPPSPPIDPFPTTCDGIFIPPDKSKLGSRHAKERIFPLKPCGTTRCPNHNNQPVSPPYSEREISAEEQEAILAILSARYKFQKQVEWAQVEAKLRAKPAKLAALKLMDDSGSEPNMYRTDGERYAFAELAKVMPPERRGITYPQAVQWATSLGGSASLIPFDEYVLIHEIISWDIYGAYEIIDKWPHWTWLDTSHMPCAVDSGYALRGGKISLDDPPSSDWHFPEDNDPDNTARCMIIV
jgi:hypothetical protein